MWPSTLCTMCLETKWLARVGTIQACSVSRGKLGRTEGIYHDRPYAANCIQWADLQMKVEMATRFTCFGMMQVYENIHSTTQ